MRMRETTHVLVGKLFGESQRVWGIDKKTIELSETLGFVGALFLLTAK